eukprot:1145810-Pelagomonas_calceolata.AAC.4
MSHLAFPDHISATPAPFQNLTVRWIAIFLLYKQAPRLGCSVWPGSKKNQNGRGPKQVSFLSCCINPQP